MAIMVIGGGREPDTSPVPVMRKRKITSIGGDMKEEGDDEPSGGGSMEHAAALVADALGVEADNAKLAKALSAFVSACEE